MPDGKDAYLGPPDTVNDDVRPHEGQGAAAIGEQASTVRKDQKAVCGLEEALGHVLNGCRVEGCESVDDPGNVVERFWRPCYPHAGGGVRRFAARSREGVPRER
jgi:hypothetical protein